MDRNFDTEEIKQTIENLCVRTKNGTLPWACEEYLPASLHLGDEYGEGDEKKHSISHAASFLYDTPGSRYAFDITESVAVDGKYKGCTGIKFYVYDSGGQILYGVDEVIDAPGDDEYGFLPLCDAVFEQIGQWLDEDCFAYMDERYFYPMKGTTAKHKKHPLCRLMERLMNARRIRDFHLMIMDTAYRDKLLAEISESD